LLDEIAQRLMLGGGPILLTGGVRIPAVFYLDQYVLLMHNAGEVFVTWRHVSVCVLDPKQKLWGGMTETLDQS
jgi:hypothetical protein